MTRVLIIDDEDLVRRAMRLALERAGHEVVDAPTCDEGLRIFAETGADLVIVDLIMPERDGFDAIEGVRNHRPRTPIMVVTGGGPSGPDKLIQRAMDMGAAVALKKPVDRRDLLEGVDQAMSSSPTGR